MPVDLFPKTAFFSIPSNGEIVIRQLQLQGLSFPLIGKPDVGGRGRGVKVLNDEEDVKAYVQSAFLDFHIQEFVSYRNETGIFYYRYPGDKAGRISGIVRKEFLKVTGDGIHSIKSLLMKNKRAILQMKNLEKAHGERMDSVLAEGEQMVMVPYGNHARGAEFLDDSALIDEQLTLMIDGLSKQVKDFYFGRLDIRYNTWEELKQGKSFSIIEVNGAGSEPTHIYDPHHSIFFAWKEIIRHWVILWRISRVNHRLGHKYLTTGEGISMFRQNKLINRKLAAMSDEQ